MVSTATIISMFVPIIFSISLFVGFIMLYRKKTGIQVKPLIIGAIGFIVFTQVLEKAMHFVVITNFPTYNDHPWLFGTYGAFAAGLFEEVGRWILFTWLLKKYRDYKSGISFGIGWGGIEAILVVFMIVVPNLLFAFMINSGTLEAQLGGKMPAEQLETIKESVLNNGVSFYLLACVERLCSMFIQIALSLLVLLAVTKKKFTYVIYAVLIHVVIDFPFTFIQTGHIKSLWFLEIYIAIIAAVAFLFIKKTERKM
ncbi:YhfC family intramembrane metalloprotease [Bacillus sp. JJ1764]|uniref:YhfC family intramembrane metalloprotease n=1 Tax=Bacillus sp. JJ1764 TaxID=3122964 RepID=UPI002FFDF276